jgi:dihydroorotate dehydrogenase
MRTLRTIAAGFWRRVLFWIGRREPERAHDLVLHLFAVTSRSGVALRGLSMTARPVQTLRPKLTRHFMGIEFAGPVGLAAGFDKNGRCLPALAQFGFGFLEAGGVTLAGQPGNPKPRISRYAQQRALINAMGFPNDGVDAVTRHLQHARRPGIPVGWNLAKSRRTPLEKTGAEYAAMLERLWPYADYFSLNISSPNTPGLRQLENPALLSSMLREVVEARDNHAAHGDRRPLLLKVSPDMHTADLNTLVDVALDEGLDGIIAVNTSTSRMGMPSDAPRAGGVSGRPLHERAVATVAHVAERAGTGLTVIGVGGIMSPADAARMMSAGASLVEVCTGFIFGGPPLIEAINDRIRPAWLTRP